MEPQCAAARRVPDKGGSTGKSAAFWSMTKPAPLKSSSLKSLNYLPTLARNRKKPPIRPHDYGTFARAAHSEFKIRHKV